MANSIDTSAGPTNSVNEGHSGKEAGEKKPGGGMATGGGINFQAAVTAIAGAHLLHGSKLDWLPEADVPSAVWAESEGAGDDIRLELSNGTCAEVQVKKGLSRGPSLWEAMASIITAVNDGRLDYAMLAVCPNSSGTVRDDLAIDLERIAEGRTDHLTDIGQELRGRIREICGEAVAPIQRLAIQVINAVDHNEADIRVAKGALGMVCADVMKADSAWNILYQDAVKMIGRRGRWTMSSLIRLFRQEGVVIRDAAIPASVASRWSTWVRETRSSFSLPAGRRSLPLDALIRMQVEPLEEELPAAESLAAAFARYNRAKEASTKLIKYDAEWTGRFWKHAVVVAGPGLGKSTLMTLLASRYADDEFLVLGVDLRSIAAAMAKGATFEQSLIARGLDGSRVRSEQFELVQRGRLVVLADGLDECGSHHDLVARRLLDFSKGYPWARIVVTTRPIGYTTLALSTWKHYRLLPPERDQGAYNLAKLVNALMSESVSPQELIADVQKQLDRTNVAGVISVSPQLLGMSAVLLARTGSLPNTRPHLYEELLRLFETTEDPLKVPPFSRAICTAVLNALGWLLVDDPLVTADDLKGRCAELMATSLGRTPLLTRETVEPVVAYWERLGIIEKIYHNETAYIAFIHRGFSEFVAARHLKGMSGAIQAEALDGCIDKPDWHEVIAFASGIGLGGRITSLLLKRSSDVESEAIERTLDILRLPDAAFSADDIRQIAEVAFAEVGAASEKGFRAGLALVKVAEAFPGIVGALTAECLEDENSAVRLVSWACELTVNPRGHNPDQLTKVLRDLLPTVKVTFDSAPIGGTRIVNRNADRDLIQRIALVALEAQKDSDLSNYASTVLSHKALESFGFALKVTRLLEGRGVVDRVKFVPVRPRMSSFLSMLSPPREWHVASRNSLRKFAELASSEDAVSNSKCRSVDRYPLLGALMALTGFLSAPVEDVYEIERIFELTPLHSILRAVAQAADIDEIELASEAQSYRKRLDDDAQFAIYDLGVPSVDVTGLDWGRVAALVRHPDALTIASNHGSVWLAELARKVRDAQLGALASPRSLPGAAVDPAV